MADQLTPATSLSIAEHGLIGDLHTAALVATDGTVDWFCCPRFDSPSVFGALLDPEKGGHCRIRPVGTEYVTKQLYLPDTAVLITRFLAEDGVGEVVDFMPPAGALATTEHRLVRMVRCVRGQLTFEVEVAPRFDYGRREHSLQLTAAGAVFTAGDAGLTLHAVRAPDDERLAEVRPSGEDLLVRLPLSAGQTRGVVLEWGAGRPREVRPEEIEREHAATVQFWRSWLARSTYRGRWREMVQRSAITLKLMTYAPTGALVAAPTAALPEQVGGERNWDYRYTWVRDASFSVRALLGLGFVDEAAGFALWLRDRVADRDAHRDGPPLDIMYRVDGSSDLVEESLDHWSGYRGSRPVRIGNGAAEQLQLDIYGEAFDSLYAADRIGVQIGHRGWTELSAVLDWLVDNWDQPEEGIWETRGGRKDFTYGRAMSWVAFDRGDPAGRRARPAGPAGAVDPGPGRDLRPDHGEGLERRPRRLRAALREPGAGLVAAADVPARRDRTARSAVDVHVWTRCGTSWSATASSTGTTRPRPRTGWRARRARSRCARSTGSTRWPGPSAWTRPGWCSRRC